MILFKINAIGVPRFKLKRDAPRPVYMNREASGVEACQRMEIPPGNIHVFRHRGRIKRIEPSKNSRVHFLVDPSRSTKFEQFRQSFVSKFLNHKNLKRYKNIENM